MPLNTKGKKILAAMQKEYGKEKGKAVFYASENKGTIKGVKKKGKSLPNAKEKPQDRNPRNPHHHHHTKQWQGENLKTRYTVKGMRGPEAEKPTKPMGGP